MPKVIVLMGSGFRAVTEMFQSEGWEITNDLDEADLVQFVGGADVTSSLYNQYTHATTRNDYERDMTEQAVYTACLDQGIPMAGICRGGQFLNVMNGGKMWQDVDGHSQGNHEAWVVGASLPIIVTSTHHQMMDVNYAVEVEVILTAGVATRKWSMSELTSSLKYDNCFYPDKDKRRDIEACYYPGTRSLCFQPHPEFGTGVVGDTKDIYFEFLERYLFGGNQRLEQAQQA